MNSIARVPAELAHSIRPAVEAALTTEQLARIFANVRFKDLEAFAAPEPSIGAAVRLANGGVATLVYGKGSRLLRVDLPESDSVGAFLREVTLPLDSITWRRSDSTGGSSAARRRVGQGARSAVPPTTLRGMAKRSTAAKPSAKAAPKKAAPKKAAPKKAAAKRATAARPAARKATTGRGGSKAKPARGRSSSSRRSGAPRLRSR